MMKLRASEIHRTMSCAHWLRLPHSVRSSKWAQEGTEKHAMVERGEGLKSDDETVRIYQQALDDAEGKSLDVHIEKYIECVHPLGFSLTGHPDAYYLESGCLYILDLKTGATFVETVNPQMLTYAYILHTNMTNDNLHHLLDSDRSFCFMIFQAERSRSSYLSLSEFLSLTKELYEKVNSSLQNWTYEVGMHCRFAPCLIHCKKMLDSAHKLADWEQQDYSEYQELLRNQEIILKALEEIKEKMIKERPDWFDLKIRNKKVWVDETKAPTIISRMTPAQALKENRDVEWNIDFVPQASFKIKQ
jgi:hypothetical protein